MVLGDPVFDFGVKLGRLGKDLFRFGLGCDKASSVIVRSSGQFRDELRDLR
jgi:hypothetical protein